MGITDYDVRGETEYDEDGEHVLREGDPHRSLLRYLPDGSERYVHVRVNIPLLAASVSLTVMRLAPVSPPEDLLADGLLLTPAGSVRSFTLLERICADLAATGCPARFLAIESGHGGRDFYFATEDVACLAATARAAAAACAFELSLTDHTLADVAPLILPTELIGDLGLPVPEHARLRRTRFEFWGAAPSLTALRAELERRGYEFLELTPALGELTMARVVPIDGPGFSVVLREVASLARSLQCSYRGAETAGGSDQFALGKPLPARYAEPGRRGLLRRLLGRDGS